MSRFADVVVPFPLPSSFTYTVPDNMVSQVEEGSRVVVPFGPKRYYTGVVRRLHDTTPQGGYEIKALMAVLDPRPILRPEQMKFWEWMADYYLCTIGDVCRAALPSGLRIESETRVRRNPDFVGQLTDRELRVLAFLPAGEERAAARLEKETGIRDILPVVKSLLDKEAIVVHEQLRQTYRPKMETMVRLAPAYRDPSRLLETIDQLQRRAPRQAELLLRYINLSQATGEDGRCDSPSQSATDGPSLDPGPRRSDRDNATGGEPTAQSSNEWTRAALLRQANATPATLTTLVTKGILELYQKEVGRLPRPRKRHATPAAPNEAKAAMNAEANFPLQPLSPHQQRAYEEIKAAFEEKDICLLHGVTGSGKTEIYIHLMAEALARGEQVLYLLPEIALTAQIMRRLERVFGEQLGVYHSRFTDAERVEVWQRQLGENSYGIILGVRSSIFLPFRRLGLVIIDEEHETSYKQQAPAPRYHGRNAAMVLATMHHAKALLGTATPSLESWHYAHTGKYGLVELQQRYRQMQLPEVVPVDVRELRRKKLMTTPFSPLLLQETRDAVSRGEQVILFQNRRGYAQMVECHTCGWVPRCKYCDVSLTYHKRLGQLTCHYCGYTTPPPRQCPACEGTDLRGRGLGTERIEDDIHQLLPTARVARMDLDTTRTRSAYGRIIDDFEQGETDILIGTQMVSKGLDFDRVSVVGILSADSMLSFPDFRAYERAFQLMAQVAGRSGRRDKRGRVILQTRDVEHPIIAQVRDNDYEGMAQVQLSERQAFFYPPFCRLVYIYLKHRDEELLDQMAQAMAQKLRAIFGRRVLGPDRPPVARVQALYIRRLVLKVEVTASMSRARQRLREVQAAMASEENWHSITIYYDVDPV